MLDIFGNVFGRSKPKGSTAQGNVVVGQEASDDFVVVGQTAGERSAAPEGGGNDLPPLYPTILTDSMLRTVPSTVPSTTQTSTAANVANANSRHPFSHQRADSNPIDIVPFTSFTATGSHSTNVELSRCAATIDRVGQFLSNPAQSEYNFQLENSILSESLLS